VQLLNNGGDPLTVPADGNFTFATQLAAGSPYNVTVGTQPAGASCSVSAGSGNVAGTVSNVAVTCSPVLMKNIALFLDSAGGTILTYAYDAASGQLTSLAGPDVSAGADTNHILVNASASRVYTLTPGSSTGAQPRLAAFKVGLGGVLTANGVQTLTGNGMGAALDVAGDTLYVLQAPVTSGQATTIMTYPIDPSTGAINAVVGTPAILTATTTQIYRSPAADYLYAIDPGDGSKPGTVTAYAIGAKSTNTTTLQPTAVGAGTAVSTGTTPTAMAFTPDGKFAYVLNNDATVSLYSVGADGSLTAASSSPTFTLPVPSPAPKSTGLTSMAMDPGGQYLYVYDGTNGTLYQLKIDANTGALSALSPATVQVPSGGSGISMVGDTTGAALYVVTANGADVLTQNPGTGMLSPAKLSSYTFATGTAVVSSAFGQ
jgi:6-phosphogluconolactonase (cycloisomerase 2 family)